MNRFPPLFQAPASWVTSDVLAAVPDFARIVQTPPTPQNAAFAMGTGFHRFSSMARPTAALNCAASHDTRLVIEGEASIESTRAKNPQDTPQHSVGAVLRDPKGKAPAIRIRPSWDPIEAAQRTLEILMSEGTPGADYELTLVSLAPGGALLSKFEDPDSVRLHMDLLHEREKAGKPLGLPYRETGFALTSENAVLYEARHVIFPIATVTMMDLQANFIEIDEKERTLRFELRQFRDRLSKKTGGEPAKATLRLSAAEWDRVTETRGFFKKERVLRPSDFWNLLTREVLRNLIREKLQTLFVSASDFVAATLRG